jgi:hypothetical protein
VRGVGALNLDTPDGDRAERILVSWMILSFLCSLETNFGKCNLLYLNSSYMIFERRFLTLASIAGNQSVHKAGISG